MNTQDVINQVAEFFKVSSEEVKNAKKNPNKVYRHIAVYLCTKYTLCTYETLCSDFGLKSKSSIYNSVTKINSFKINSIPVIEVMNQIEKKIKG